MMASMAAPRLQVRPNLGFIAGVFGAAFAVLVAGAIVTERHSVSPAPTVSQRDLHAVLAYADAIAEPTHLAGQAIVLGIRPDISDFTNGVISTDVWKTDMEARAGEFSRAWATFRSVPVPKVLGSAQRAFDQAFADYLLAAQTLWRAGDAVGAERDALIMAGGATGDAGDGAFDRGAGAIQRIRRAAGLAPDPRFPDKARA